MNRVRRCVLLMMGLLLTHTAVALTQSGATENSSLNVSLSKLTDIEHQITTQNNAYPALKDMQNQLEYMNTTSMDCIKKANEQIEKIDKILGYLSTGLNTSINEHNTFLIQEKNISKQKLAECSFVSYRSEEVILLIQSKISTLELPTSWVRSLSIRELIQNTSFSSLRNTPFSEPNIALFKELITTAIMLLIFYLSWFVLSLDYVKNKFSRTLRVATKWGLAGSYSLVITLHLAGFHHFALMLIPKLAASVCISIIAFQLIRGISRLQHAFDLNEKPLAQKIHSLFGIAHHELSPELVMIRTVLYVSIVIWSSAILSKIWGLPAAYRDRFMATVHHGITVFDVTIYPAQILRAILIFFVIMLLGRYFSNSVMQSKAFKKEKHVQLTISTLIRYATFIIATVLSLYIAGISFAGVAIAVGALLVGVGFGLQQIVSDFIAGLILLSNNVIRPGDYVLVDGTEGTVVKIRLLATEVRTSSCVVLVPNSSFIGKSVSNYTYQGQVYYAGIQIVIEQMSDVSRAEKIVLDAAANNPRIIKNEENQPCTSIQLFDARGTMGIYLSLYFPIATASEQHIVSTALNRVILDAFEADNINAHIMRPFTMLPTPSPLK